jgi:c-di-GMP-binding flagellar brake protein YcgR
MQPVRSGSDMAWTNDLVQDDYSYKMEVGVRGEIVINAGVYKGRYTSRVEDLKDEMVGFAHPLLKGTLLPVYRDLDFDFVMEDSSALYVFEMTVKRVEKQGNLAILWAYQLDYPKRIQRRGFLRVSCLWNILIFHLGREMSEPMSSSWRPAKAVDISLGGYRFKLNKADAGDLTFESDDRILVFFTLSERQYMLSGRGTRIVQTADTWEVGVGFDSLSSSMEKKLFEYIRQQEMHLRDE